MKQYTIEKTKHMLDYSSMKTHMLKPGQNVEVKRFWAKGEEAWFGGFRFLEFRQIRGRMSCVVQPTQGVFQDCKFNYSPEKVREIDPSNEDAAIMPL